ITASFTPRRLGCKARFSEVFQLAAVQTPVLSSPTSAPGWAVSAKQVAMQQVARETWVAFERRLERAQVPAPQRPDYHKWTRFYLDFCQSYGHESVMFPPWLRGGVGPTGRHPEATNIRMPCFGRSWTNWRHKGALTAIGRD